MSEPHSKSRGSPIEAAPSPWAVLGVLLVALGVRVFALTDDLLYDHLTYAQYAFNLTEGTFTLRDNYAFAHRLPVFIPVSWSYALFGVGAASTHLWPVLLSLFQIGVVVWLGTRLFDRSVGLLSGLLVALNPLEAVTASSLGADVAIAAFLTGGAAFWWLGNRAEGGRRVLALVLSGAFVALGVLTRVYAVLIAPLFLIHTWMDRIPPSRWAWVVAGGLAVAVPVAGWYWVETGSPLYSLTVQSSSFEIQTNRQGLQPLYYFWHGLHPRSALGLFGWLFLAGVAVWVARPTRAGAWLLAWAVPFFLFLQFGTMSLTSYKPVFKTIRYLTPILAPLSLLAAAGVVRVIRGIAGGSIGPPVRTPHPHLARSLLAALLVVVAAHSIWILSQYRETHVAIRESYEQVVTILEEEPDVPVHLAHWRTALALSYYFDFEEGSDFYRNAADSLRTGRPGEFGSSRLQYLVWYDDPDRVPPGFVVLDRQVLALAARAGSPPARYLGVVVPSYCYEIPADWELVYESPRLLVYQTP